MNDENENIMRAIAQLQAEGKVRVIGETIIHLTAPEGPAVGKFEAAGLVFAFTDQSPSYCAGFEAGMVWQRMQAGEAEIDLGFLEGFPVRHENLETFARMAAAAGYRMEHQSSGYEGWEQMRMVAAPKAKPSLVLVGEPT